MQKKYKGNYISEAEKISDRDNYIKNRDLVLDEFKKYLEEVKINKPNIEDVVGGENFQEYTLNAIFRIIKDQERYTVKNYSRAEYIIIKEEKIIFKQMIKDTKKIFKENFDRLYNYYLSPKENPP